MIGSWINDWNQIIRNKIFADNELKTLMNIPANTSIIKFIDEYFIRTGLATTLLTNQSVRILYSFIESDLLENPNMRWDHIRFDIYIKNEDAHNVGNDRLIMRKDLIAIKLKQLLTEERVGGYKLHLLKEKDSETTTIGYTRYTMLFGTLKVN